MYNPSRRNKALLPSRSRRSYSARILSLYWAENTRRVARSGTSGSVGSSTGTACRPDTSVVTIIGGHFPHALRLTNFGFQPASPNVDTEGIASGKAGDHLMKAVGGGHACEQVAGAHVDENPTRGDAENC